MFVPIQTFQTFKHFRRRLLAPAPDLAKCAVDSRAGFGLSTKEAAVDGRV